MRNTQQQHSYIFHHAHYRHSPRLTLALTLILARTSNRPHSPRRHIRPKSETRSFVAVALIALGRPPRRMAGISPTVSPRPSLTSRTSPQLSNKSLSPASPRMRLSPPASFIPLEICVDSLASCQAAHVGGASRLELCSGLLDGGVTPSYGLIGAALAATPLPVNVLIRPRPGDFVYSEEEVAVMTADIMACKLLGVNGVVIGCLDANGRIHRAQLRELMAAAKGMSVTFHRAIDMIPPEWLEAELDCLIDEGVDRLLTSGLANDVTAGTPTLARIVQYVGQRLVVMAGGGVTEANIGSLVAATGVHEVHGSARSFQWGESVYRKPGVYMGGEKHNSGEEVEYGRKVTDADKVKAMVGALKEVANSRLVVREVVGGGVEEEREKERKRTLS